jgi:hypothetical protein
LKLFALNSIVIVFLACFVLHAEDGLPESETGHELSFYVIPSSEPLCWESPSTLFTSYFKSYKKHFFRKEKYLMGHLFVKLNSPFLDEPLLIGIGAASKSEQRRLILKEKIGFSILKTHLKGHLETTEELLDKIDHYAANNQLAKLIFKVSNEGMERILTFLDGFVKGDSANVPPASFYGGTFYPRYHYEGAGCTALGMAMLDLCGVDLNQFNQWLVEVKIPMGIIGGVYNNNRKIGIREIKKTDSWHNGDGQENREYISHYVYDPSLIYNWILDRNETGIADSVNSFDKSSGKSIPLFSMDISNIKIPVDDPVFIARPNESLFINEFFNAKGISPDFSSERQEDVKGIH